MIMKMNLISVKYFVGSFNPLLNRDVRDILKYAGLADIYDGDTRAGQRHGRGALFLRTGARYEGDWINGEMHGHGRHTYANGDVYDGELRHGQRHGRGRLAFDNQRQTYDGDWVNDKWHGQGTFAFQCHSAYAGEWLYSAPDTGNGRFSSAGQYVGGFSNGLYHGHGRMIITEGAMQAYRRRIYTNEDDLHNRMISSYSSNRPACNFISICIIGIFILFFTSSWRKSSYSLHCPGENHPIFQIVLVKIILFLKSSWCKSSFTSNHPGAK